MVHLWQNEYGRGGRSSYHNIEWADKMDEVGLIPTATGEIGGKRTGNSVTHCIVDGGRFQQSAKDFLHCHHLAWQDFRKMGRPHRKVTRKDVEKAKRLKVWHICPRCGQRAEAQDTALLICGVCNQKMRNSLNS
jgi:hypothetical protein